MVSLPDLSFARQTGLFVLVSSLVLTTSFVGGLGLLSGALADTQSRLPVYVLGMAVVFVASMFGLITYDADGVTAMFGAVGISLLGFVLLGLAGEGIVYAIRYPNRVFGSQLVIYFLAAGLIGTGLGYWVVSYWREFTAQPATEDESE